MKESLESKNNTYRESIKYFRQVLRGFRDKDRSKRFSAIELKDENFKAIINGCGYDFSLVSYWSSDHLPTRRLWLLAVRYEETIEWENIYRSDEIEQDMLVQKELYLKGTTIALEAQFLGYLIYEKVEKYLTKALSRETLLRKESGTGYPLQFPALSANNNVISKYGESFFCEAINFSIELMPELKVNSKVSCMKHESEVKISASFQGKKFFLDATVLQDMDGVILFEGFHVYDKKGEMLFPEKLEEHQNFFHPTSTKTPLTVAEGFVATIRANSDLRPVGGSGENASSVIQHEKMLRFESEKSILEYSFDPEVIFSRLNHVSRVPEAVLDFYTFSDQDTEWVKSFVTRELQGKWVSFDNQEAVLIHFMMINFRTADKYFAQKFPLFSQVANKFYKPGSYPSLSRRLFSGEKTVHSYRTDVFVRKRDEFLDKLRRLIVSEGEAHRDALIEKAYGLNPEDWRKSVGNLWQPLGPRPIIPPAGLTPKEAEIYVSQMLNFYGLAGVKLTRYSRDGGVDVESDKGVFQVKHQAAPVGVGVVREIFGVAASTGKRAGVFAKVGFTKEAIEFAERNGIVLFSYTPTFQGRTKIAEKLVNSGFEAF